MLAAETSQRRGPAALWALMGCAAAAGGDLSGQSAAPDRAAIPPARAFHFVDVAPQAGLARIVTLAGRPGKDHLLDSAGTGAAFLDYDRDGRLDAFIVNGWRLEGARVVERGLHSLLRGRPDNTFEDVTAAAGVGGGGHWGAGVTAADYDGDGWTDLLVTHFGPTALFRNRGDGTFEDTAPRLGLDVSGWFTGAAFFDAEGDGDLDVYIAAYIDCTLDEVLQAKRTLDWKGVDKVAAGPFGMKGARDRFFRADGGRFVDATAAAGFEDRALAFGFGVRAGDFDDDGDADVFVANDSDANYLYRNEGGGRFKEVGLLAGCALNADGAAQASMGVAAGAFHGQSLDVFVTNFAEDTCTLYQNIGKGLFEDVSAKLGLPKLTYTQLSWGTAMADLDHDGDLDLVVLNGHIYPQIDAHPQHGQTFAQRALLLESRDGKLLDASSEAGPGFQTPRAGRGLAIGDYDNDGDLDLLQTALDAPVALLRNESAAGSWLIVSTEDASGRPVSRVGTRVRVQAGGRTQIRDVAAGDSFQSTHDPRPHFGLGSAETAERVEVEWPDGTRSVREKVPARQVLRVGPAR